MNINLAKELNECYVEYVNFCYQCMYFEAMGKSIELYAMYKDWTLFFAKQVIDSGRKINHNQALLNIIYS